MTCDSRPYRLRNVIQHYSWGTREHKAFIPQMLSIPPEPDTPYAELWMGAHPSAPSEVFLEDGSRMSLIDLIRNFPEKVMGLKETHPREDVFPFLLKVLSAGEPLSIQVHPDTSQAAKLHQADPEHYPDASAKPEIAIALDGLTALVGFLPSESMFTNLIQYPEIRGLVDPENRMTTAAEVTENFAGLFRDLILRVNDDPKILIGATSALDQRLRETEFNDDERARLFNEMFAKYGPEDIGLVFVLILNLVHLEAGEAIYLDAGLPHAYLQGNIVECMSNSDNVVRAGLTPKLKDLGSLAEIIRFGLQKPDVLRSTIPEDDFEFTNESFQIRRVRLPAGGRREIRDTGCKIVLVSRGVVKMHWETEISSCCSTLRRGHSVLIPTCLEEYCYNSVTEVELFEVSVPETDS